MHAARCTRLRFLSRLGRYLDKWNKWAERVQTHHGIRETPSCDFTYGNDAWRDVSIFTYSDNRVVVGRQSCSPPFPCNLCMNCAGTNENTTKFGTISSCCATQCRVLPLVLVLFRSWELHLRAKGRRWKPHLSRSNERRVV